MLDRIAASEGGLEEETTYDGRKIAWTQDAKRGLWTMKDAYKRRRAKARVEKAARVRRLDVITLEFAHEVIEEESGVKLELPAEAEIAPNGKNGERRLIARDARKNPLISAHEWTAEAVERLFQVPAGYMRDKTQERSEQLVEQRGLATVEPDTVQEGIEVGARLMEEMLAGYEAALPASAAATASGHEHVPGADTSGGNVTAGEQAGTAAGNAPTEAGESKCPFAKMASNWTMASSYRPTGGGASADGNGDADSDGEGSERAGLYLNEVSLMSALAEMRKKQSGAVQCDIDGHVPEQADPLAGRVLA